MFNLFIFTVVVYLAYLSVCKILLHHTLSWQEIAIQGIPTTIVLSLIILMSYNFNTYDEMIVNGKITDIQPIKKNCKTYWSSSPDSFCTNNYTRTVKIGETCSEDSKGNKICTPIYDTEYMSIYNWERRYFLQSTIGEYEIDREDKQGVIYPQRFKSVKLNDPVSKFVSYTNYIKGASNTLFKNKIEDGQKIEYPVLYDYYKIQRVFYVTDNIKELNDWNDDFSKLNSSFKDANVILFINYEDKNWPEKLAQDWYGHNINDVIIVIGLNKDETISHVDVRSWSSNDLVNISIRDEILNLKTIDKDKINSIIYDNVNKYYIYQSMDNFKYLEDDIEIPSFVYVLILIILLLVSPVITYFFHKNEDFK